jgi:hypothetical protein
VKLHQNLAISKPKFQIKQKLLAKIIAFNVNHQNKEQELRTNQVDSFWVGFGQLRKKHKKSTNITELLKLSFLDACDRKLPTNIAVGNVLILGSNDLLKDELSTQICTGFIFHGKVARAISAEDFLKLNESDRKNKDCFYVIDCDPFKYTIKELALLKKLSSTQIFFKLKGLDWNRKALRHAYVQVQNALVLDILNDYSLRNVGYGLIASLGNAEFCVVTDDHICKRRV